MSFEPTEEQQAVIQATRHGRDSLLIRAYAGCAKTTTLTLAAKEIKIPGLALAFNKHIKAELASKFPGNFVVQTMNGLGHQAIGRAMPQRNLRLDDKKLGRLIGEVAKDWKTEVSGDQWDSLRQLVSQAMNAGLVPSRFSTGQELLYDEPQNWQYFVDDLFIEEDEQEWFVGLAHEVLERHVEEALSGIISFDDQNYFSVCVQGKFPQFPLLMVDEAQDLSPLNHEMVRKSVRPDGRLIVCGDEKQAIYGFRGADHESMGKLRALRGAWVDLPLTQTFRCPKAVVARQQAHAPGFRAAAGNKQGLFTTLPAESKLTWGWDDVEALAPAGGTLAVLCRNNAPLLSLAFKLLRQRIAVSMLGRDIGQGLVKLVKSITRDGSMPIAEFAMMLEEWKTKEVSLAIANGKEHKIDGITDRVECLEAVMTYAGVKTAADLSREITALFAKENGRVNLASIHKAKGLEWDLVLLLDPWRIPSKQAKNEAARGNEAPIIQEWNLKYVAETRSKEILIHASIGEFE